MAGNFWLSSQNSPDWLTVEEQLEESKDRKRLNNSKKDYFLASVPFLIFIQKVGEQAGVKQPVISTATVYFKRLYLKNSFSTYDPLLVAATCLFLAGKTEESPIKVDDLIKYSTNQCFRIAQEKFKYAKKEIMDFECELSEELKFNFLIFHPYVPLVQYIADLRLFHLLQHSWNIVNDSYRVDVILLFPPYLIALGAIYMALITFDNPTNPSLGMDDLRTWIQEINVSFHEVRTVANLMIQGYEFWQEYMKESSANIANLINRLKER